jgi:23S rRNA pseudouridine955/2504/2580 synthase
MSVQLTAGADDNGRRLDRVLRKALPELPLSAIHRLLRRRRILVDGKPAEGAYQVREGSAIYVPGRPGPLPGGQNDPGVYPGGETPSAACPGGESPGPDILWEGQGLLALNKPAGLEVHGPGSLETRVAAYLRGRLPPSLSFKPGPLHRLDKPSSGIVLFSTTLEGARYFSRLLRERRVTKQYLALAEGAVGQPALWEDPLIRDREAKKTFPVRGEEGGGTKTARTRIVPLASSPAYSLVMAEISTGRTHQIRAQAAAHGHPLWGDRKYGGSPRKGSGRFLLHAYFLEFPGKNGPVSLRAPVPEEFRRAAAEIFGGGAVKIPDCPSHGRPG